MFSVDENGIVTYTNQTSDKYYRNYSLLKHMKQDNYLTGQEYDTIKEKLDAFETGVALLGEEQYYMGYCPLEVSHSELICLVPASVLNHSLLAYQRIAVEMIVVGVAVFGCSMSGTLLYGFQDHRGSTEGRIRSGNPNAERRGHGGS